MDENMESICIKCEHWTGSECSFPYGYDQDDSCLYSDIDKSIDEVWKNVDENMDIWEDMDGEEELK